MTRPSTQLERLIARTRRRLLIADVVRLCGLWLTISAAFGLVLTLGDRFLGLGLPAWLIATVAISGAPLAGLLAWRRRADNLDAAVMLDDGLRLKDRLGTSIAVQSSASIDHDNPMMRWVHEDAERLAARIDPRAAARIYWPMSWGAAALGAIGCVLLLWLVEPRNVLARPERSAEQIAARDARQRAAESLRQRAQQLRARDESSAQALDQANADARQQALDTLDRLARQLDPLPADSSGDPKTERAAASDAELSSAAREAIELADRLDRESQIAREAHQRVAERLADMQPAATPGAADDFADSLKEGDLAAAAEWLESLEERLNAAPPEEREAIAQSLRDTAEEISKSAEQSKTAEQAAPADESPEDLGLTAEQMEQWLQETPSLDEIRRELQDQGHDPIDAQQLAEQVQRELAERAAEQKSREQLEETARRLSELAETIEQPPADPQQQPPDGQEEQPPTGEPQPGAEQPDESTAPSPPATPQNTDRNADGSPKQPDESTQPGKQDASQPGGQEKPQPGEEQGQNDGQQGQKEGEPQAVPKEGPGGEPKQGEKPASESGEQPKPGESPKTGDQPKPGETSKPDDAGQPEKQPGESPKSEPGAKEPSEPGSEGAPEGGAEPQPAGSPQPGEQGQTSPEGSEPRPQPGAGHDEPQGEQGGPGANEPGGQAPTPGQDPDSQASDSASAPGPGEQGAGPAPDGPPPTVGERARRVREMLDQIDQSGGGGPPQDQEISQEMRDAAEELLEQMSPEERQEIERWAAEKARENSDAQGRGSGGSPESLLDRTLPTQAVENPRLFEYDTEDVGQRDGSEPSNDRVIAEMYGPDHERPEGAVDRQPMDAAQMREAAQAIERALNEEAIPPRYRSLIRNWARRLPAAAQSPAPTQSPER